MKKIFLFAAFAAVLAGCSDDTTTNPSELVKPGSDITFGISLSENPQSRTMYGDEKNNAFPIYWVNDEQILVASPQCAVGRTLATYKVSVNDAVSSTATAVTKVSEAGVQWGETLPANFYSIYPVGYTTIDGEVKNSITNNTDNAVAHLNVRNYQRNVFTLNGSKWEGVPVDRASNADVDLCQKYPDALMYAQKQLNERGDVMLQFNPFTVAFNITLEGYKLQNDLGDDPSLTIEEIIITAPEETHLAGNFDATFDADCANAPEVNKGVNTLATKNEIHITTLSTVDGSYLTINKNQSLSFNVFAIPTGNIVTADWKITVRTVSGTFIHNLAAAATGKSSELKPGMVHKLTLPKFQIANEFEFDPEKWMTQIPRNVYITELSVPGAWNTLDESNKDKGYQNENVAALWKAGVRAFGAETRTSSSYFFLAGYNPSGIQLSGTGSNIGGAYHLGTNLKVLFEEILTQVASTPQEYGVFVLTYADGGNGGHREKDYAYWLEGIYNVYNSLTETQKGLIYKGSITTNTTINDVLGKLILIVQVGSNLPGGNITLGNYASNLPALLAHMNMKWTGSSTGTAAPVSNLYWKEWSDSFLTNFTGTMSPSSMYWNYTQANRTQTDKNDNADLPTYSDRQDAIKSILKNSRNMYLSGEHNIWFYVGAGGVETTSLTDDNTDAKTFAATMNEWINTQLEDKISGGSFSPFGIVMCNYMSGTTYYGQQIINNIIKMNRLFRLNRDESAPEWPGNGAGSDTDTGGGDSSSQATKSAGTFSVDTGNWDVF